MALGRTYVMIPLLCLVTLASTKPIMVTFGTNQGPIIPRQPKSATLQPKTIVTRSPAPVSEDREDVPNPRTYKAPVPRQYRTELYSFKPALDLVLGTPLDQKYTPAIADKVNQQRKEFARSKILGVDYTGPHTFEKQDYEILESKKNHLSWKYNKPHYYQELERRDEISSPADGNSKYVPQIGVIYSAGVRYYVPQFVYYNQPTIGDNSIIENSVYDESDAKYQH